MYREKIGVKRLNAWVFAATVPVLVRLLSGSGWVSAGVLVSLAVAAVALQDRRGREPAKWQCPFYIIYIVLLLTALLPLAADSWPSGETEEAVWMILLLLAAVSAGKGPMAASAVGAVLFWVVLILYGLLFLVGIKDVRPEWLKPQWTMPQPLAMAVLLIAPGSCYLTERRGENRRAFRLAAVTVTAAAALTAGVLSPWVAVECTDAFYVMSRSGSIEGIAGRLEPLVSAAMTVGWFALVNLLLTQCGALTEKAFGRGGKAGVWLAAAATAIGCLCGLHISGWLLLGAGTVFWVFLPALPQGLGPEKKS